MKKLILLLTVFAAIGCSLRAQVCTPDTAGFTAGVVVYPSSLTLTQGVAYSGTTNILIPDSLDASAYDTFLPPNTYYVYLDSVFIDSIAGMPVSIAAATNPGNGVWLHPGQYACIQFSGTTTAAAGSYPIYAFGGACVHGNILGFALDSCQNGQLPTPAFFNFSLNVNASSGVCTPDSAAFTPGVNIYPATLPCITTGSFYSGYVTIRVPDSLAASLFVSGVPGEVYVDSVRIDSITGMPAGITVATNPADSEWLHANQFACAEFSGITNLPQGNFPINVYGRGCVHGTILGISLDTCIEHDLGTFFAFSLNICGPPACTIDSSLFGNGAYVSPPSLPCIVTGQAYSNEVVTIEVPDSLDVSDFITQITIPPGLFFMHIDSIDITTITGYPQGISSVSNPVLGTWLYPSSYACANFSGMVNAAVTPAGNYPLTIAGEGCGHGTFSYNGINFNIDTCIQTQFTKQFPFSLNVCYPAGIDQVTEGLNLSIYPNPNQGNFTVTISSSSRINGTMSVIDQLGRVISAQNIDVTGTQKIPLDLGEVSAGAYLLMINSTEGRSVKQFIIR